VFVAQQRATSAYNSCLHAVWTPSIQSENIPVESSSEELLEEADEPAFWQQDPPADSRAFMSTIWWGMKKIFRGQTRLGKQELQFDSNNNERKDLLIPMSPSVQACSHSSTKLVSPLSYIKKVKNYIKGKIKTYTKKN